VVKDNDILNQRLTKAQQDYENQLMQSDQLAGENSQKNAELKLKEEEILNLKSEIGRVNKLRDGVHRRLRAVEEHKAEVESNRESLKQQITSLERGEVQTHLAETPESCFQAIPPLKYTIATTAMLSQYRVT